MTGSTCDAPGGAAHWRRRGETEVARMTRPRAIFWGDEITVLAKGGTEFQIRNQLGEVCSVGRVAHLARSD